MVSLLKFRSWLVVELSCDQNDRRSARRIADLDLDPRPLLRPHAREANSVLAEQGGARGQVSRKFPLRQQPRLLVPVPAETREPHGRRPETGAQFNSFVKISTDFSTYFSTKCPVLQGVPHYYKNSVEKSTDKSVEISKQLLN